jgi:hypothetical protein
MQSVDFAREIRAMNRNRDVEAERILQARRVREEIERRVEAADTRLRRLEAERDLIARRLERREGGSTG